MNDPPASNGIVKSIQFSKFMIFIVAKNYIYKSLAISGY
ncbi:hypothetical protein CAter282_4317 [Collimonas arenae]|uniref:Uncharacterized protein n=2 Tax=Collimonas TaxID=202907 RepID=A0A127QPS1_9BURK|nr:hypothetical protein CAter10_4692 [Collimonas arenae]AMP11977.1 hypothetical protein CAter282_4317 [Collimonas arenae]AMP17229.1 hypothetical protein CPter291_5016 [Collimonas pratensis]